MIKNFFVFILLTALVSAQSHKSIHQIEQEYYSKNIGPMINSTVLQLTKSSSFQKPNRAVFGFLPWWEYAAGSAVNLRYDLLTHIAVAFFEADGDGNIKDPPLWPWNDVIKNAHNSSVKLILALSNFDPAQIHRLLTESASQQKLFAGIAEKIKNYGFDGVNIDFENLLTADQGIPINSFVKSLNDYIKSRYPLSEISFDSPAVNNGGWNFNGLANSCDYLFVMGYDFYGSWSTTTGPSAPYNYLTSFITQDYSSVSPAKIILGVPYFGNYWRANLKDPYTPVTPYDSTKSDNNWIKPSLRYKEIIPQYSSKEILWDDASKSRWLRWQDTKWNQIWYDDPVSLSYKYDFALTKNFKGIGIWALGYDNGRAELWDEIRGKFVTGVAENFSSLPSVFELYQNYPNPFNPETVISYRISSAVNVQLRIFDILGREVATIVNEVQQPGIYKINFNVKTISTTKWISSGVYFYQLKAGTYSVSKKMLLLN